MAPNEFKPVKINDLTAFYRSVSGTSALYEGTLEVTNQSCSGLFVTGKPDIIKRADWKPCYEYGTYVDMCKQCPANAETCDLTCVNYDPRNFSKKGSATVTVSCNGPGQVSCSGMDSDWMFLGSPYYCKSKATVCSNPYPGTWPADVEIVGLERVDVTFSATSAKSEGICLSYYDPVSSTSTAYVRSWRYSVSEYGCVLEDDSSSGQ